MLLLLSLLLTLSFATFGMFKGVRTRPDAAGAKPALVEQPLPAEPVTFSMLYDQYAVRVYQYIYHRVGNTEVAEDLSAQVFVRVLEAMGQGRGCQSSSSGWLFRIAHNLVIDHYRLRQRSTLVELDDAAPVAARDGDPVRGSEALFEREQLIAALSKLTDEQAEVIALRFLEDLSISEVADTMAKTEGAVKALQYRAVLALRRVMQP